MTTVISADTVIPKRQRTPARAEFLSSILTTAVEGGINYWASVSDYHWWDPDLDGGTALHAEGLCNAYAVIHDDDQGAETSEHGKLVTVDDIARALGVLRAGHVTGLSETLRADIVAQDRANGEDENHQDIDADLADCIVQIALFGEAIYG